MHASAFLPQGQLDVNQKGSAWPLPAQAGEPIALRDVVRKGGKAFRDRPEALKTQRTHRQTSEWSELNALGFTVVVCVFPQLDVARPVSGVLAAPAIADAMEKRLGTGEQAHDGLTAFLHRLALTAALAKHHDQSGTPGPVCHNPLRTRQASQNSKDVTAVADFAFAGRDQDTLAIGQPPLVKNLAHQLAGAGQGRDQAPHLSCQHLSQ